MQPQQRKRQQQPLRRIQSIQLSSHLIRSAILRLPLHPRPSLLLLPLLSPLPLSNLFNSVLRRLTRSSRASRLPPLTTTDNNRRLCSSSNSCCNNNNNNYSDCSRHSKHNKSICIVHPLLNLHIRRNRIHSHPPPLLLPPLSCQLNSINTNSLNAHRNKSDSTHHNQCNNSNR